MENYRVKDLMVPLSEYATVDKGATLFEAILALERAQEEFDHTKYRHRGVLILDKNKRVIGKLGQLDVLRALQPRGRQINQIDEIEKYGFSPGYIHSLHTQRRPGSLALVNLCREAATTKVEELMQTLEEGEHVDETSPIELAIHQLVFGHHLALLVTRGKEITGILRLTDVFAACFHTMKECEQTHDKG